MKRALVDAGQSKRNVAFGSFPDFGTPEREVRFTIVSGYCQLDRPRPLTVKSEVAF
jgi:hypothetical protein